MFLKKELANTEKLLAQKMHRNQSLEKQNLSLEQQNQILEQENKRLKQVLEKIKMQVKEVWRKFIQTIFAATNESNTNKSIYFVNKVYTKSVTRI